MNTVFVTVDGTEVIPSTVYPGPTAPGTVIRYGDKQYEISAEKPVISRVQRHASVGDVWQRTIVVLAAGGIVFPPVVPQELPPPVAAAAALKKKGKDKQATGGKALVKEG